MSMWEDLIKCFRKGAPTKRCSRSILVELYKRVPPNQRKQLNVFASKHEEYKRRISKYPDKMPTIDWAYYKANVRPHMVNWVKEFEQKYDKLDSVFENRHTLIDHSKYFGQVTKETEEVKLEVEQFKKASQGRIQKLQQQIEDLKAMKPYTEMTMEEYCFARPNEAPDFINKPTFWPHTPEEQKPGPSVDLKPEKPEEPEKKPPKGKKPTGGSKSPPKAAKPEPIKKLPLDTPDATKAETVKPKKPSDDSKKLAKSHPQGSVMVDQVFLYISRGFQVLQELGLKIGEGLSKLRQKVGEKQSELEAKKRQKEASEVTEKDDGKDNPAYRMGSKNICNKTIIKGDETSVADVKEHHEDLNIEGDVIKKESVECEAEKKREKVCEAEEKSEKEVQKVCYEKCKRELDKDKDECYEKKDSNEDLEDICKVIKKKANKSNDCQQKLEQESEKEDCLLKKPKKFELKTKKDKCSTGKEIETDILTEPQTQTEFPKVPKANEPQIPGAFVPDLSKPSETLDIKGQKIPENTTAPVKDFRATPSDITAEQNIAIPTSEKNEKVTSLDRQDWENLKADIQASLGFAQPDQFETSEKIAKSMFDMAIRAAHLLAEAKHTIQTAQQESAGNMEALKQSYSLANEQVSQALTQAKSALTAARKLTGRVQDALGPGEAQIIATVEKHMDLAQVLAKRAIAMQKEIGEMLKSLL